MRTLRASLFSVIVLVPSFVFAQSLKPGEWRTYTSMRSVTAVAVSSDSNYVWAATSGGAFRADLRDAQATLTALRTTDGLTENDLTAVATDAQGNVYFGGGSGGFDIYNSSTDSIYRVPDIHSSPYADKTINAITVFGNKIYVATGYGVSVYLPQESVFGATVTQLASLPPQDSIQQVIDNGSNVFAAAHEGVVWAGDASDLHASSNWQLMPDSGGSVRALAIFNGTVYAGATNGLFAISQNPASLVPVSLPLSVSINRLLVTGDSLYILDQSGMLYSTKDLIHVSQQAISANAGSIVTTIAYKANNGILAGSISNGIAYSVLGSLQNNIFPPGPIANAFSSLSFSTALDQLYVSNQGSGFGIFQPSTDAWQNYQNGVGNVPNASWNSILYDSIRKVTWLTSDGPVYKASGLGSLSPVWNIFDTTDGMLPGYQQGNDDISDGCIIDAAGNFVVTTWAGNGKGLCISTDGETFTDYSLAPSTGIFQPWGCVTQDMNGNYWVGTVEHDSPKSTGVYWLNPSNGNNGEIPGGDQGSLGPAIEGTEYVNAILTDQDDGIWCGTEGGVEIISDPESILQNNQIPTSIRSVQFTTNQVVYTMAVDGVGNKWIGTTNGIFVVSPDGSDSVAHFTAENSPLVNDDIISLAIDPTRGEAYAATPSGISRFSTIFKQGKPDYSSIRVYPNPVVQTADATGGSPTVYIDGLVAGSTIQIFSLAGRLITTIDGTNYGATIPWNGRDALGRQVPSGMYLISATSPQSGENGEAKVVIVRKPSN